MTYRRFALLLVLLLLAAAATVQFAVPGGIAGLFDDRPAAAEPYACPMVEDAEVRSDRPGPCPKCGMDLVPLSETEHKGQVQNEPAEPRAKPRPPAPTDGEPRYYCPMHPTYTSDRPGTCPICNMNLVPLESEEQATESAIEGHATVRISPERQQLIGVRFGTVAKQRIEKTIRAVGRVDYDERRLAAVNLKFAGWVEELFVQATGQVVHKGDPLLAVYSPELLEAQRSYLIALENSANLPADAPDSARTFARETLRSARERLLLWDLTDAQIEALDPAQELPTRVTLHSKVQGVVTRRNVVLGGAIQPGTDLYEIADLSVVWVYADVYEHEIPEVRVGQPAVVTLATRPGESFQGQVTYVYPYLNESTRTARVRLEVPNPDGKLMPGMYGDVALAVDLGERLVVDEQAIVETGTRSIVFVDLGEGRFEPREVVVAARANGLAAIGDGLREGERIVTSGNFLIDSESRLKAALIGGGRKRNDAPPEAPGHAGHGR